MEQGKLRSDLAEDGVPWNKKKFRSDFAEDGVPGSGGACLAPTEEGFSPPRPWTLCPRSSPQLQ